MISNDSPQDTFVLRFWRELPNGEPPHRPRWRGRIEHLQSGQALAFDDPDQVLEFVDQFLHVLNKTRVDGEGEE
jgi:hypothetical protein